MGFEFDILYALQGAHTAPLDTFMVFCTSLNDKGAIWIALSIVLALHPKYRKLGLCVAGALVVESIICAGIIKPLIARARPCDIDSSILMLIERPFGHSFPSLHTASSFAAATALLCCRHIPLARKLGVAGMIIAIPIAFSRLYLFVHFPTDVLCGAILGIACGYLAWRIAIRAEQTITGESTLTKAPIPLRQE